MLTDKIAKTGEKKKKISTIMSCKKWKYLEAILNYILQVKVYSNHPQKQFWNDGWNYHDLLIILSYIKINIIFIQLLLLVRKNKLELNLNHIITKKKLLDILLFYYLVIILYFYIIFLLYYYLRKLSNTYSCLLKLVIRGRSLSNN